MKSLNLFTYKKPKDKEAKKAHRICWNDTQKVRPKLVFDGTPYVALGRKTLECYYGPDRNKAKKRKKNDEATHVSNVVHFNSEYRHSALGVIVWIFASNSN